ncbi:MAG: hypothetical protein EPO36_04325 [Chloroflexota bacterium]|nr:MAG: hypothetical protein EPO36_04325 [Chloroflexota bacterium]
MTIDAGTGDGRAVLAAAARDPRTLAIGLDAVAVAMAESSRRAARPEGRGGLPNALFAVSAVESAPAALRGLAARVTVQFPWASLLRGCLGANADGAAALAALVAPGGTLELLLAPAERDGLGSLPVGPDAVVTAATATFEGLGLATLEARAATGDEVRATSSTWARRLLGGARASVAATASRPVLVIRFRGP